MIEITWILKQLVWTIYMGTVTIDLSYHQCHVYSICLVFKLIIKIIII